MLRDIGDSFRFWILLRNSFLSLATIKDLVMRQIMETLENLKIYLSFLFSHSSNVS